MTIFPSNGRNHRAKETLSPIGGEDAAPHDCEAAGEGDSRRSAWPVLSTAELARRGVLIPSFPGLCLRMCWLF